METTALKGRQGIQQEIDILKMDWDNYTAHIRSLRDSLDRAVNQWGTYEDQYDRISAWVKDMEKKVKDFPLKSTLEEKQQQLHKYQVGCLSNKILSWWWLVKTGYFFPILFWKKLIYDFTGVSVLNFHVCCSYLN